MKLFYKTRRGGDYALLVAVVILAVIGTVFIYSASNYSASANYGDAFYFVKKQAGLDMHLFNREVVLTVLIVTAVSIIAPYALHLLAGPERTVWMSLGIMFVGVLSTCITAFYIGMTATERKHTIEVIVKFKNKIICRQ